MFRYFLIANLWFTTAIFAQSLTLTPMQKQALGLQIWQNEGGQKVANLVHWNQNETFMSLGIGHFIWYPAGQAAEFTQQFPELLVYFKSKKVILPNWLEQARLTGAPWPNRGQFLAQAVDPRIAELRQLLAAQITLQTEFIIAKLQTSWPAILAQLPKQQKRQINLKFQQLSQSLAGLYALIDYLNFKGAGLNPQERYQNHGWGLLQVLQQMPAKIQLDSAVAEFVKAAKLVLEQRVQYAPAAQQAAEQKWLVGWKKRLDSYEKFSA